MAFPWGAVIAAGASILGDMMRKDSGEDANALGKEAAQMGIRWKVADAKAAGLHPLFALGGSGATYSPVAANIGGGVADAGQNIGRAVDAAVRQPQELELRDLQLQKLRSEIDESDARKGLLESQMWRNYQGQETAVPLMPKAAVPPIFVDPDSGRRSFEQFPDEFPSGSVRERAAGRAPKSGQGDLNKVVPMETLHPSRTNLGIAYGPGDPAVKRFHLPFTIPFATEHGQSEYQAAVLLPTSSQAGSAEAIEALEGKATSGAIAALNVAYYGPEVWQAMKEKWSSLRAKESSMGADFLRRFTLRRDWRGSGRHTGR